METGQLTVSVGGSMMAVDELVGTNVVNRQDQNLGEIEDVVYNSNGQEATHVIVSTDDWFDGRTALIPVSSLEQADQQTRDDHLEGLLGGIVVLDMAEERFESIATFKRGNDLEEYLEEQASQIAEALELDEIEIFDEDQRYHTAVTNRSREENQKDRNERDSQSQSYSSNSQDWKNKDSQQYRYSGESVNWENRSIEIDGQSLKASELQGVEVVNNEDDRLGKVVDIIVDENKSSANYLVVRTDDWFDGDHAVVPARSLKYHADTQDPHPDDGAHWWMGDHVVLDMDEDKFEEIADYRRDQDPNTYIKDNRDRISDSYGIDNTAVPEIGAYYTFVYSVPYTTASYENSETNSKSDRDNQTNKDQNRPSKDQMVEVGDERVELRKLKGKKVKANDGKKVATVSDVVADAESGNIEFLVLKNSRSDENTIVPISAIESSKKESDHKHKGKSCATWDGKSLTLSDDASEFRSWASFESADDFDSFLDRSADQLSDAFGIDESEITDSDKSYVFVFEPRGYQTASR